MCPEIGWSLGAGRSLRGHLRNFLSKCGLNLLKHLLWEQNSQESLKHKGNDSTLGSRITIFLVKYTEQRDLGCRQVSSFHA